MFKELLFAKLVKGNRYFLEIKLSFIEDYKVHLVFNYFEHDTIIRVENCKEYMLSLCKAMEQL